jgi:hypothetical protein
LAGWINQVTSEKVKVKGSDGEKMTEKRKGKT